MIERGRDSEGSEVERTGVWIGIGMVLEMVTEDRGKGQAEEQIEGMKMTSRKSQGDRNSSNSRERSAVLARIADAWR